MSDVVIQVDRLWKKYRLGVLGTGTLRYDFNRWLHRTMGKGDPYAKVGEGQKIEERSWKLEDPVPLSALRSSAAGKLSALGRPRISTTPSESHRLYRNHRGELLDREAHP